MIRTILMALLGLSLFFATLPAAWAQGMLSGTVQAAPEKSPLHGANVYWIGTTLGTTTDSLGRFRLERTTSTDRLVIRFIGFKADTISTQDLDRVEVLLAPEEELAEVEVVGERAASYTDFLNTRPVQILSEKELFKAACCNLAESFETSAAVDVSFTDAVTGTRQIEMLGLSGTYSQLTTENMPAIRGLAAQQGLTFLPGTWIESIQISKGAGSVVNGYESISGQINVELRKPEESDRMFLNLYTGDGGRMEANLNLATKLNEKWSTALLAHGSAITRRNDMNKDGFMDFPLSEQVNVLSRWRFTDERRWLVQFGARLIADDKVGGQVGFRPEQHRLGTEQFGLGIRTRRADAFGKIALMFPGKPHQSLGLQLNGIQHRQESYFGQNTYDATHQNLYANLIFQSIIGHTGHHYRIGASFLQDRFDEEVAFRLEQATRYQRTEVVPGIFAEYTYNHLDKISIVAGIRADHHNLFGGWFLTPRLHSRFALTPTTILRASAGRGQRTANIFAENSAVFASARQLIINSAQPLTGAYGLRPEVAWNYGLSLSQNFETGYREGSLSVEMFHTEFQNQIVADFDRNPQQLWFYNLSGRSYSTTLLAELNYEIMRRTDLRIAYKWLDVQTTYHERLLERPLVARHRWLGNIGYRTPKGSKGGQWLFDYTLSWFGSKRLPETQSNPADLRLPERSPSFVVMNAQVTYTVRNGLDFYVGAENLNNFQQDRPILGAENPFGPHFDTSMVWGPIFGRMAYVGMRWRIE